MCNYIVRMSALDYKDSKRGGKIKMLASPTLLHTKEQILGLGLLAFGEENNLHQHDYSEELFYIIKGNGEVMIAEKKYVINEGDIIRIPQKTSHKLINNSSEQMEYLFTSAPLAPSPKQGHRDLS